MEYRLIKAKSPEELTLKINNLIIQGWEPLGGISACWNYWWWGYVYYQAVITSKR